MTRSLRRVVPVMLLLLMVATAGLPRVVAAQDEKVELLVWDQFVTPDQSAVADSIYKAFTDQHPNVTIKREAISSDQLRQTVRTAMASGTGPDVIFYDAGPGYAGVLASAGLLSPLDDMASQYGWKDRIAATALKGTTLDGKLYGLPLQVDLIGMYLNKTLMDKEGFKTPTTIAELATLCKDAKAKGYDPPIAFADSEGWEAFHQFSMAANNMIGPAEMEKYLYEGQANWNTPEMVKAIQAYFVDLKDAGCFSADANAINYNDGNALFFSGQSLIHTTGSWLVGDIETNMQDQDVQFVQFPAIDGGKGQYWVSGVGSAYFISAASKHQAEAGQFLDYLFAPETVGKWIGEAKFIVPAKYDAASVNASPLFRSILDTLADSIAGKTEFGYNVDVLAPQPFNDAMQNGFQAMLAGQKTAEQQAADMEAAWKQGSAAGTPSS